MPIIKFDKHSDKRGELIVSDDFPFEVVRIFWIKKVPTSGPESQRGGHAHRTGEQVLIPVNGSFKVSITTDGVDFDKYLLHDDVAGLYIPPMTWIDIHDFTPGAICEVWASDNYDEADHIRDYNEFLKEALGEGFLLH